MQKRLFHYRWSKQQALSSAFRLEYVLEMSFSGDQSANIRSLNSLAYLLTRPDHPLPKFRTTIQDIKTNLREPVTSFLTVDPTPRCLGESSINTVPNSEAGAEDF